MADIDIADFEQWYNMLCDSVESIAMMEDNIRVRDALYLYLLYRDMYGTSEGPIEEDMVLLLDSGRVTVHSDGIDRTVHLYDHQSVQDYVVLIRDRLIKEIELSSHCYLKILPQLETVTVSATEQLRRSSADEGDIDWDDYTEAVPEGLENVHIRITRSTR